jgi:hypothetical protein
MPPKKKNTKVENDKENKPAAKELNADELKEYLKNFILIPKDQWKTMPVNSYISYIKEDGKFVKGGFVKLIFNKKNTDSENESEYLIYGTKIDKYNNDKYYKEFTINLSNIKDIYKRIEQSAIIEYQIIKNNINKVIAEVNNKIEEVVNKLLIIDKKISKLEDNHYKTLKLIKNLHNIKTLDSTV